MTDFLVRPALLKDIPAITRIFAHEVRYGTASWAEQPPSDLEMLQRLESLNADGYPFLVAERSGVLLGYCYASAYRTRHGYRFLVENSVYVDANCRGQGVASQLLRQLLTVCNACGFRQMIAVIGDSANAPSIALHRSAGFIEVGRLPNIGFKFGRWLDSVLMQRTLGQGASTLPADGPSE